MFGHYTCYTPNGASVVDYVMVSEDILDQVLHFRVSEFIFTLFDTHCKLEWTISARFSKVQKDHGMCMHPTTPNFILYCFLTAIFPKEKIGNCFFRIDYFHKSSVLIDLHFPALICFLLSSIFLTKSSS